MKSLLICVFLILTSLGTSSASGNTDKKGVHVVDNTPDSFRQRIIIDENLSQRNVVIEIDFISVKMLVTLRLDTKNMNTVTTTLLHGKSSLRRPENRSEKQSTRRKELPKNCYGWMDKTWNTLYELVISLFGWTELPKGINTNIFNWRSVTMSAEDSTCPGHINEIPVKEHGKDYMENLGTNQTQGGSPGKSSRSGKQSIRRKELPTKKRPSWIDNTWHTLYEVIISLFGWTQLPHNINTNIFNWRSVTMSAVHSTHPGHTTEKPVKEHGKDYVENLGTNQAQGGSAKKRSSELLTNNGPSWMVRTWNTLYEVIISLFGWTQLPHNINTNIFNWRSVTMSAVHSTHPGHATEKPVMEHDKDSMENIGTNQAHSGSVDQSYRSEKQSIPRKELPTINSPSWMDKTWNTLYEVIISLFGWTQLPHNINTNIFNWRSVTMSAVHSTHPGHATEKPVKEHGKDYVENLGTNQAQGGSAKKSSSELLTNNTASWMVRTWNTLYEVMISLFGWTQLPHNINTNILNWRSITMSAVHSTHPGDNTATPVKEHDEDYMENLGTNQTQDANKRPSWTDNTWNTLYEVIISLFGWTQLPHNINTNIFNWRSVTMSAVHSTHPGHATETPVKEHDEDYMENLGTNQTQDANKRPSWTDNTWHTLYEVMISLFGWTQLPHNINTNIFNWRSVTMSAVHSTHPGHATEKPVKEHGKDYMENLGTNQTQGSSADKTSRSEKQSTPRKELPTNNRPSWMNKTWITLYEVIISLFGWTQLPHNINTNIFNWRSVTMSAVHSTYSGDATEKPVKEHGKDYMENIGTNQAQGGSADKSSRTEKQSIRRKELPTINRPSWMNNTWNTLYEVIISLFGWTQLPHNINTNIFNWRSVTMSAVHSTHPGHAAEKPVKEHDEDYMENLDTNQAQGGSADKSSRTEKQSIRRKELPTINRPSWMDKTWNTLYEVIISLFGWTQLPHNINTNIFNWRSVTMSAVHSTHPGHATEKPVKEHDNDYVENLGTNRTQGGSAKKSSSELLTNNRPSWMVRTWNTLYEVIISLFGWTQLPHNINTNIFNWRSVTMSAVQCTNPGDNTATPVKEHDEDYMENLGTNQAQDANKRPSWMDKIWDTLYEVMISLFGWTQLPHNINTNMFNWRSVTMSAEDSICPGHATPTPVKEHDEDYMENLGTNQAQDANKRPSWTDNTWYTLYEVMISLFGWTQLPHNINTNIFNWRSVTMSAVHSTHPGHVTEKPVKEHDEDYMENLGTNQAQGANNRPSWMNKTWNTLYEVIISLFGWTQLPHNINTNIFNWRSVTMSAVHSTHPGHATEKPVKEHDEDYMENLGTNQAQDANNRPSWTDNTWHTLYEVIISLFGWTQFPHNINTNIFNWRSVTMSAVHSTHPGHATEKPVKEHDEDYMENLGTNQTQGANNRPSWMNKTWNTLYEVIISLFGWTQLPHNINTNIFNWRSVTMCAVHSTHPGDAKLERRAHRVTKNPSDSSWISTESAAPKLWYKCMAGIQRLLSSQICDNACNLIHDYSDYWTNWTWQDTFDVMIISWMINFCAIALYFTIHFTGKIIRLKRLQYAIERERLRELKLARERAAQPKPWRPKPKKKRRKKLGEW
ncbi:uncharacterized protein LOC144644399 isoform X2 [Oculina patagonica]